MGHLPVVCPFFFFFFFFADKKISQRTKRILNILLMYALWLQIMIFFFRNYSSIYWEWQSISYQDNPWSQRFNSLLNWSRHPHCFKEALLNRISHGTDSSHVWKIRSDLSRGVKNSTEFFTAAERIPHLSVTNSFGISFIYSTQTYLSPFKKNQNQSAFFSCTDFSQTYLSQLMI